MNCLILKYLPCGFPLVPPYLSAIFLITLFPPALNCRVPQVSLWALFSSHSQSPSLSGPTGQVSQALCQAQGSKAGRATPALRSPIFQHSGQKQATTISRSLVPGGYRCAKGAQHFFPYMENEDFHRTSEGCWDDGIVESAQNSVQGDDKLS